MQGRYLVYELLDKQVAFVWRRRKVCGIMTKVCRDVFQNTIVFCVRGQFYPFQEPDVIQKRGNALYLCYGKRKSAKCEDRDFFRRLAARAYRESPQESLEAASEHFREVPIEIKS